MDMKRSDMTTYHMVRVRDPIQSDAKCGRVHVQVDFNCDDRHEISVDQLAVTQIKGEFEMEGGVS